MNRKAIEKTELNKILQLASEYAVARRCQGKTEKYLPCSDISEDKKSLKRTEECVKLLFTYGVWKIEYFPPFRTR